MKRKIMILILVVMICIFLSVLVAVIMNVNEKYNNENMSITYNGLPVNKVCLLWTYSTSTPEMAVGAHQYVFVAKVNKILRTEYKNPVELKTGFLKKEIITDPYTVYSISVIKNIKGELITSEELEYRQFGGISEDGDSYTFTDGVTLLDENEYYILMADTSEKDEYTLIGSKPNTRIELGNEEEFELNENEIIEKYVEAYKNQYKYDIDNIMSKYDVNFNK